MAIQDAKQFVEKDGKRFLVQRYRIIGTRRIVYCVYEPTVFAGGPGEGHSTVTSHSDVADTVHKGWWGRLGTRRLTAPIDALPVGAERFAAVRKFHEDQYQFAYALIQQAFPESRVGNPDMGELSLQDDE